MTPFFKSSTWRRLVAEAKADHALHPWDYVDGLEAGMNIARAQARTEAHKARAMLASRRMQQIRTAK